ncbi:Putative NAD(P)H nitroreductase [Saliniradius amylolyticus]|uniref:Putative NAD(P)H nitroreductase n=1 Tax=Saliniradius amylolyticus TaxID=2183582 RepID=A0A2S2E2E3_9ALTE|nr:NAD(P)H nitroreductase [Saliniradius amylolyticus]AWL11803.1 Putative NAD(P)H nitroreductase [Saliniradius amylolyticus]
MQALELLLTRSSQPRLQAPAPEGEALENIMQAALRAPDHGALTPWRFIVCQGKGLKKLGDIFEQGAIAEDMSAKDIERAPELPKRAPMVIVAISKYSEHPKVPWVEQVASTSCAVHAMQMAAVAQGYSGMWRTGSYAQNGEVKNALGLAEQDEIVGFLYLGTPVTEPLPKPQKETGDFFEFWD